jgi:hypothetical protein
MRKIIFLMFMAFTLASCNSVLIYQMDILRPGYFMVPSDTSSIILVDNSGIQPANVGHTYCIDSIYFKDTTFNTEPLSGILLESLLKNMSNKGFFQKEKLCKRDENKFKKKTYADFLESKMLKPQQIAELSDSGNIDVLVSLDRLILQSRTNVQTGDYLSRATRDVTINSIWRVFNVKADSLLSQFQYNDSLFWENYSYEDTISAEKKLPAMEETLPEIGTLLGEKLSLIMSPHWETVSRPYFSTGSFRMKFAVDCIRQNDWEGAAAWWKEEYVKGFGKSVYRAAMNMMLYAEFLHDPIEALGWCDRAIKAMSDCPFKVPAYDQWLLQDWKKVLLIRSADYEKFRVYFKDKWN